MPEKAYVIGDTHLGAGDTLEDFDQDAEFAHFAAEIAGPEATLFLNGDFVDFPQIEPLGVPAAPAPSYLLWTEQASRWKLQAAHNAHPEVFLGLEQFLKKGGRLVVLTGNHDLDLAWKGVQDDLRLALGNPPADRLRFTVGPELFQGVHIEHGHEFAPENCPRKPREFIHEYNGQRYLERVWGTDLMLSFYNALEAEFPYADNVKPMVSIVWHGLKKHWIGARELARLLVFLKRRGIPWGAIASAALDGPTKLTGEEAANLVIASFADPEWKDVILARAQDPTFRDELAKAANALDPAERALFMAQEEVNLGVNAALVGSAQPKVMGLFRDNRERRAAKERLAQPGVTAVVFGHTHDVIDGNAIEGSLRGQLFNPGTWLPSLDLGDEYVRQKIKTEGLTKDMLKEKSLYRVRRCAVRIDAEPGAPARVALVDCN